MQNWVKNFTSLDETVTSWLQSVNTWVNSNNTNLGLYMIWAFCIAMGVWGGAKLGSRLFLRGSLDRSKVGKTLKTQKTAESVALISAFIFWGTVILTRHQIYNPSSLVSLSLMIVVVCSSFAAAFLNVWFDVVLHKGEPLDPEFHSEGTDV